MAGLIAAAMIGLDAVVARTGTRRNWMRANLWLGPLVALISDRPIWLAKALPRPVAALPDEAPRAVGAAGRRVRDATYGHPG